MPQNAANIKDDTRFLGLFIGRSGSSKSAAAFSFPGRKYVFDLDGRLRGGLMPWIDKSLIDYDYYPPKDPRGGTVWEKLNKKFDELLTLTRMNQCPYQTIILDSITHQNISLLLDAIPLTHADPKGKPTGRFIGTMPMAGPQDYGFQSTATHQILAFLKSLNIQNIIVTAHIVPRWAKDPSQPDNMLAENVVVGEQLALTDKLGEAVPTYFDHVFRFERKKVNNGVKFYFSAQGELARSAYNIPFGDYDITDKDFYQGLLKLMKNKSPETTSSLVENK